MEADSARSTIYRIMGARPTRRVATAESRAIHRRPDGIQPLEAERLADPYPVAKLQGGQVLVLSVSGRFDLAREIGERLVAFGHRSGHSRAMALGHYGLAFTHLLALDFERAAQIAQAGIAAARDKLFVSMNGIVLALSQVAQGRFDEARVVCAEWMPYLSDGGNLWQGAHLKQVQACADLALGDLSNALRRLLAGCSEAHAQGMTATGGLLDTCLLMAYASVARLDVKPSASALMRNPWFVFTQAPLARRRAHALIAHMSRGAEDIGYTGLLALVDLTQGRLLTHAGRKAEAREALDRLRERLRRGGADPSPEPVVALAAEIDRL